MVDMKGTLLKTQKIIQDVKGMNTISVQEIRNLTETTRKIINQKEITNQEEIMINIDLMEKQETLINNKRTIIVEDTKDSVIIVSHQESIKIISQTDKAAITEIIEENNIQEEIAIINQTKITQIMIILHQVDMRKKSTVAKQKNWMRRLTIDYYEK